MREIKFRGKRTDNGEWAYGSFVQTTNGAEPWIDETACGRFCSMPRVDPATVGQFTGVTDKNNVEVYEGDIVAYVVYESDVMIYRRHKGERVYFEDGGFYPFAIPNWECTPEGKDTEIIGNVYDNPELVKAGDGK